MTATKVEILELIGWGLDDYPYRNIAAVCGPTELESRIKSAQKKRDEREGYVSYSALLEEETQSLQHLLAAVAQREDLKQEYEGLVWRLGVVDLHRLLAFQRRLVLNPARQTLTSPNQDDWPRLISFTAGAMRSTEHILVRNGSAIDSLDISLHSGNPDLQLRLHTKTGADELSSFSLYGGSPFFEVAEFRGRWFLRDGYHRAYRLLQAGVRRVPAVVIYTGTIEELGATEPWFFSEEQLFSDHPPRVMDFLEDSMVLRYERNALRKVIRIRIEESLVPVDEIEEAQGERL